MCFEYLVVIVRALYWKVKWMVKSTSKTQVDKDWSRKTLDKTGQLGLREDKKSDWRQSDVEDCGMSAFCDRRQLMMMMMMMLQQQRRQHQRDCSCWYCDTCRYVRHSARQPCARLITYMSSESSVRDTRSGCMSTPLTPALHSSVLNYSTSFMALRSFVECISSWYSTIMCSVGR